ncbi:MAG: galactokinase [Truepera sp.]|nr:galactokinase [Truepera sp.]
MKQALQQAFMARFGEAARHLVRAPGRVNLIGEHTDYNDGFVLPLAIERAVWIALRPRNDRRVQLFSLEFNSEGQFDLDRLEQASGWLEYPKGVAWALQEVGLGLRGFDGIISGDVPRGAGLSSSAALELAVAKAFHAVSGFAWEPARMAQLAQRAENRWVGVNCGIMDQLISAAGVAHHALLIDCRSLELTPVPLPPGSIVVILDTATRRGLVDSAYNERRRQCEAAAHYFGVTALRDVSLAQFSAAAAGLEPIIAKRARHVISENERTLQAAEAMRQGHSARLGQLMNASHASLRDDFEVSSAALNAMAEAAQAHPGCFGARMTGAGFGGCAVALVAEAQLTAFVAEVTAHYQRRTSLTPQVTVTTASQGASEVL